MEEKPKAIVKTSLYSLLKTMADSLGKPIVPLSLPLAFELTCSLDINDIQANIGDWIVVDSENKTYSLIRGDKFHSKFRFSRERKAKRQVGK